MSDSEVDNSEIQDTSASFIRHRSKTSDDSPVELSESNTN